MHRLTFHPLGNANTTQIELERGRWLLFDYADRRNPADPKDKRIDLPTTLRQGLSAAKRDYYDVVAITHADVDHLAGAPDFFYLEHSPKYQGDGRIKIAELWVPAALIVEDNLDGDAAILQAEARHRFKLGRSIRVFSRPDRLEGWLRHQGLTLDERKGLITDAGQVVPGFGKEADGVEFFVHSPFAARLNDGTLINRNDCSIVVQATFVTGSKDRRLLMLADTEWKNLGEIVRITRHHERDERLDWDILNIPHHSSYTGLGPEKGEEITTPSESVAMLYELHGSSGGILISTSKPIPSDDADSQPPHRQAAAYYRKVAATLGGQHVVTMEHPSIAEPRPLVIEIGIGGAEVVKRRTTGTATVTGSSALRAG